MSRTLRTSGPCRNFRAKRTEPPPPLNDEIRYISLTRGLHAIVDAKVRDHKAYELAGAVVYLNFRDEIER